MINFFKKISKRFLRIFRDESGITLIEIMIVVSILAILGTLVVPRLMDNVKKAKVSAAKTDLKTFSTLLDTYYMEFNAYPTSEEGLKKLVETGKLKNTKTALNDPWGHPYEYRSPGENNPQNEYEIWSNGEDGKPGGEGFNADIKNWE